MKSGQNMGQAGPTAFPFGTADTTTETNDAAAAAQAPAAYPDTPHDVRGTSPHHHHAQPAAREDREQEAAGLHARHGGPARDGGDDAAYSDAGALADSLDGQAEGETPPENDEAFQISKPEAAMQGAAEGLPESAEGPNPAQDEHATNTTPTSKKPPRINLLDLFNAKNIGVTIVPVIGGMLSGYTVAFVPVYSQLYVSGTNCALYTAQRGCEAVPFADCVWRTTTVAQGDGTVRSLGYCGWPSITCRAAYPNDGWVGGGGDTALAEASCLRDGRCTWSYSAGECQNPSGYSTKELGIFAGAMIAGSMFGAILGGPLVTSMGTRLTFLVSGFFSTVSCIMCHVVAHVDDFWVLSSSRFILGFFMGLITVACPLYVHENADPKYKSKIGTMFQVWCCIGSFVTGVISVSVGETIRYDANADQHISSRLQGVIGCQTLMCIFLFLLGIFSTETKVKFKKGEKGALDQDEYSYRKMWPRLLMVVALNATFRFTGFNALANFGPKLMASYDIAPYLGHFILMLVNMLGALMSMPASIFVSAKTLFLIGSCCISCMCLLLCGVPVYPGVASESVTNTCAVVGICLYIFVYEMFVGPSFYVLCQEIFPPSFRPRGNSFAQLWQFFFNLVTNICYSLAVVGLSGGPSGNQHKGQSIIFIFFGGLGILLFVYELLCLDLWDETAEAERKAKAALDEELVGVGKIESDSDPQLRPQSS